MEDLLRGLSTFGLSEKEGRVYLALLAAPGKRAQDIAVMADLPRGTCYDILDELEERGLAILGESTGGKTYFPVSPDTLVTHLKREQTELDERLEQMKNLVPLLTVFYNPKGPQPKVRYLEGKSGLRQMQKEYAALPDDIIQLVGLDAFHALHDEVPTEEHRSDIFEKKKRIRAIHVTKDAARIPKMPFLESRALLPDLVPAMGEMSVCGDRVVLFSYDKDLIALDIRSAAIAGVCRAALELAWRAAKELDKSSKT